MTPDPALLRRGTDTPHINHQPLPRYALANLDYGMTVGIESTGHDRLWATWVAGGDSEKAFLLMARSEDGGLHWSQPCMAIDPHDDALPVARSTATGMPWRDPLGRLWLFFNQSLAHFDGRSTDWCIRCDDPDAENPRWSDPQYIWHGYTLNKPTVLSNGEWMLPICLAARYHISPAFADCYHELDSLRMAHMFVSGDQGVTWARRGGVAFPETQFDEHMVVERMDGSLWMVARTKRGLWESFSRDMGHRWSAPSRAFIQNCSARFHLRRLASGRILFIKHGAEVDEITSMRRELAAFLSEDDGRTWTKGLMIDERPEVSYPDCAQDEHGRLYISYDRERAARGEILLARLWEEDILRGAIGSADALTRHVISRPGRLSEHHSK